jgi:hypothetical protein
MKKLQPDFMVYIDAQAWAKFRYWVELAGDDEVSALGLVDEIHENGATTGLIVSEIFLLDQIVDGSETTLDDKAVADLMIELAKKDVNNSRLKGWIHSHAGMKVFWSTTDDECCEKLANGSYSLSIVTNLHGDILTRIDVYNPCHIVLDKVPTQIYYPQPEELRDSLETEFTLKVKKAELPFKPKDKLIPVKSLETMDELELAFNQGYINMYEYEQLSGKSIFDDF